MRYPHGDLHHGQGGAFDHQLPHDMEDFDDVIFRSAASAAVGNRAAVGGRADDLRSFAATRAMKTGTTIAGVVFEVRPFALGRGHGVSTM